MGWTTPIRINFAISAGLFGLVLFFYFPFLVMVEARPGIILADPILAHLPIIDLGWLIFTMINGVLLVTLIHLYRYPDRLVLWLQAYTTMMIFRMIVMNLVVLDPPSGMIVLRDPFIELFSPHPHPLTRDLFFSGHTATLVLCYLLTVNQTLKKAFLIFAILTPICLLIQHVHYSIDVVAAPFFAYGSYWLVKKRSQIWKST